MKRKSNKFSHKNWMNWSWNRNPRLESAMFVCVRVESILQHMYKYKCTTNWKRRCSFNEKYNLKSVCSVNQCDGEELLSYLSNDFYTFFGYK